MRITFDESRKKWMEHLENQKTDSFVTYYTEILWEYEADEDSYFIFYINPKTFKAEVVQLWNEYGGCYFEIYKHHTEV